MPISAGITAPEFLIADDTGSLRTLSEFRGHPVILYFYPKDDTPGCTTEACNFRDDYSGYEKANIVILGVSPDDVKSHVKFKKKFDLPFPLLADDGHKVCDLYEVWGPKKFMGKYEGVLRTTFLIDGNGATSSKCSRMYVLPSIVQRCCRLVGRLFNLEPIIGLAGSGFSSSFIRDKYRKIW